MKLNIANPETGCQKLIEIDDEKKLRIFFDKRMSAEVEADALGDEFKGYVFKITGGNDKQGFPMMQGIHVNGRVRLLLQKGHKCYRPRRDGEKKRKSIRGCIVGPDMSVLSLVIVKKGEGELPGLTDKYRPRRFGPKRASKIRKLFNLSKEDDVTKFVIKKVQTKTKEDGKVKRRVKIPKVQRLITPAKLRLWKRQKEDKLKRKAKNQLEHEAYVELLASQRERRQSVIAARRASQKGEEPEAKPAAKSDKSKKPEAAKKRPAKAEVKDGKKAPAKRAKKDEGKGRPPKEKKVKREKKERPERVKKPSDKPAKPEKAGKKPAAKPAAEAKPAKPAAEEKPAKPAAKSAAAAKAPAKAPAKAASKKAAAKK